MRLDKKTRMQVKLIKEAALHLLVSKGERACQKALDVWTKELGVKRISTATIAKPDNKVDTIQVFKPIKDKPGKFTVHTMRIVELVSQVTHSTSTLRGNKGIYVTQDTTRGYSNTVAEMDLETVTHKKPILTRSKPPKPFSTTKENDDFVPDPRQGIRGNRREGLIPPKAGFVSEPLERPTDAVSVTPMSPSGKSKMPTVQPPKWQEMAMVLPESRITLMPALRALGYTVQVVNERGELVSVYRP